MKSKTSGKPTKPVPEFPGAAIARLLGLTERRLQQLAQAGFIPKSGRGMYPLMGSVHGYVRYLKQRVRHAQAEARRARRMTETRQHGTERSAPGDDR